MDQAVWSSARKSIFILTWRVSWPIRICQQPLTLFALLSLFLNVYIFLGKLFQVWRLRDIKEYVRGLFKRISHGNWGFKTIVGCRLITYLQDYTRFGISSSLLLQEYFTQFKGWKIYDIKSFCISHPNIKKRLLKNYCFFILSLITHQDLQLY